MIWNIGDIDAYQGMGIIPLTLAFQVSLTPNTGQVGSMAILVERAEIVGQDKFTKDILGSDVLEIDTNLTNDESVSQQQGIVINN